MRAILVFYMYYELSEGGHGLDQTTALSIMSIYGFLVYMFGVIGGWLADRIFGTSKAVFYGGILIMIGHIALAISGSLPLFFVSMVLIGIDILFSCIDFSVRSFTCCASTLPLDYCSSSALKLPSQAC